MSTERREALNIAEGKVYVVCHPPANRPLVFATRKAAETYAGSTGTIYATVVIK